MGSSGQESEKFSPEFKEEAAKMVVETSRPITHVARELSINETTLGNWVKEYRGTHADDEPALPVSERARLRELERDQAVVGRAGAAHRSQASSCSSSLALRVQ
jgi:transposase